MASYEGKRARTREALLQAGMAVVAERGVSTLAIGEVAHRAGVVAGTFYNHFPTREDFVAALAEHLASDVTLGVEQVRALEGDPAGRVALAILGLVRRARADPEFAAAFAQFLARVPSFAERLRALAEDTVRDGVRHGRFTVPAGAERAEAAGAPGSAAPESHDAESHDAGPHDAESHDAGSHDAEAAEALIGLATQAMRSQASGRGSPDAPARFAALALQLLGIPPAEASHVVATAGAAVRPLTTAAAAEPQSEQPQGEQPRIG